MSGKTNITNTHSISDDSSFPTTLRVEQIFPSKYQPRTYFDEAGMAELIASVKQHGIITPILVRPIGPNQYELVAGERRYKAAKALGLVKVPAVVRAMSETEVPEYALVENLQREDLNPVEETEGILQLLALTLNCSEDVAKSLLYRMKNERGKKAKPKSDSKPDTTISILEDSDFNEFRGNVSPNPDFKKVEEVFYRLGKMNWQTFIRTRLPILQLPLEILEALRQGRIEYTKAQAIAQLKEESERLALLGETITKSLSLSKIRERIKMQQLPTEREELQVRIEAIPKKIKKLNAWDDPDKRAQLELLLTQIESVLSSQDNDGI